jgi:hypothetical protein
MGIAVAPETWSHLKKWHVISGESYGEIIDRLVKEKT